MGYLCAIFNRNTIDSYYYAKLVYSLYCLFSERWHVYFITDVEIMTRSYDIRADLINDVFGEHALEVLTLGFIFFIIIFFMLALYKFFQKVIK